MISREHRFIFIHVPKTGGSSIGRALEASLGTKRAKGVGIHHDDLSQIEGDDFFTFAFHRNPWDRFVSLYAYWMFHHVVSARLRSTFPHDFQYFCRNAERIFGTIDPAERIHLLPQTELNAAYKDVRVDFWGRFEHLQADFDIVCDRLRIERVVLGHERRSQHRPYVDYYDKDTRDIVAQRYESDIEAFGYQFEAH